MKPETTTSAGTAARATPAPARATSDADPAAREEPPDPSGGFHSGRRKEPVENDPDGRGSEEGAETLRAMPSTSVGTGRLKGTTDDRICLAVGVEEREEVAVVGAGPPPARVCVVGCMVLETIEE